MADEKPRYTVIPRVLIFVFKDDRLLMMKYSGKGEHQTQEKSDRKDIYNCIGGHVEQTEDIIETAVKEAREEAGINLLNPKIAGIINVSGFADKNIMNFIVTGTTEDETLKTTLEGELTWIPKNQISTLNVFPDMGPILEKLLSLESNQMFVGTAEFEKFDLKKINLRVV